MVARTSAAISSPHSTVTRIGAVAILWSLALLGTPSTASAQTLDDLVARNRGGCTTSGSDGLSAQLVRTHLCMYPGAVTTFAPHAGITLTSSRVHALSSVQTRDALHAAAARGPLQVNSAFRTMAEQYMLYYEGGCGRAAIPGSSNHQSGVAVDLQNYSAALGRMRDAGCRHPYPTDDAVHFDCPGPDMRSASVRVFQRLWNVNNPGDTIAEDGSWGPMTRARLGRSPAGGFRTDGCMVMPPRTWGAAFVAQSFPVAADAPITMRPGEELEGYIELRNTGTETWDGNTRLATTQPRDRMSAFAASGWMSPSRPAGVTATVPRGGTFRFTFRIRAPEALGEHSEYFGVVQEGVTWFSAAGQLGPPDDQLQIRIRVVAPDVMPMVDAGTPGEVDAGIDDDAAIAMVDAGTPRVDAGARADGGDEGFEISGGCSCGAAGSRSNRGSAAGSLLLMIAVVVGVRLRRRAKAGR